ncbi:hypothetical protein HMPREF2087_00702 [Helicobacter canis NCTC 12740]|uniref:Uncharacterized protein n=1 Tax=Helicobacter canis NCTC 12740 TaxID=1357399 RepID=V8CL71_9HELI|nr:hypothetical protein HMPREF2087_00702 [Helicobacter canis NCTC 12740]
MRTYITPKPNPHKPMGPICIAAGKGKAGWPSTTGNESGGGRDNNPPKPKKK